MTATASISCDLSRYGTGKFVWDTQQFIVHYAYTDSSTLACPIMLELTLSHALEHDTIIHVDAYPFDDVDGPAAQAVRLPSQVSWDLGEGKYFDQKTGREYKGANAGDPIPLPRTTKDAPRKHQYNASSPVEVLESSIIPAASITHECGLRFNVLSEHCGKRPFLLRIRGIRASDEAPVFHTEASGALVFVTSKPQSKKLDKSSNKCVLYSEIVKIAIETAKTAKDTPKKVTAGKSRAKVAGGSGRKSPLHLPEAPLSACFKMESRSLDSQYSMTAAVPCVSAMPVSFGMNPFPHVDGYGEVARFHSLDPPNSSTCQVQSSYPDASSQMYPNDRFCDTTACYPPQALIPDLLSQTSLGVPGLAELPIPGEPLTAAFSSLEIVDSVLIGQNPAGSGGLLMKDYSL
jgi:hypothetical protein